MKNRLNLLQIRKFQIDKINERQTKSPNHRLEATVAEKRASASAETLGGRAVSTCGH